MTQEKSYILTLSCTDTHGIVAALFNFLTENQGFIIESAQFGDPFTKQFFMRVVFRLAPASPSYASLSDSFAATIAKQFNMCWQLWDSTQKMRLLLMVSKQSHCLNDILHRYASGNLAVDITAIVSNHDDLRKMADWYQLPFYHLPVDDATRDRQEEKITQLVETLDIDVIVLARYMQILSAPWVQRFQGKVINIHHSFLPSFKGARPYHQAHERGVKLIGATAHYVTDDLDEGPIIEQEVARVDHALLPEDLVAIGCDIENVVLARALKYHIERRVLLNGHKTVIFK